MNIILKFTKDNCKLLLLGLLAFEVFLVILNIIDLYVGSPIHIHRFIDLNSEGNFTTWFSSIQLFWVGVVFCLLGSHQSFCANKNNKFLMICGLAFFFLSMDEASQFHEKITKILANLDWMPRFGDANGIWIFFYILIALVLIKLSCCHIKLMVNQHKKEMIIMFLGGVIFIFGAIAVEIAGYYTYDLIIAHKILYIFEEFFEMSGVSIILYGALLLTCEKF